MLDNQAPKEEVKYLAIDPGITSGWAQFSESGDVLGYGQFHIKDVTVVLRDLVHEGLLGVIVEDFKNHPWVKQRSFDRNDTSKLIGRIEMICGLREIKMVLQPNTCKPIGYLWAGLQQPSNHSISHQFDAVAHGVYWLQQNGIRPVGKALKNRSDDVGDESND